MSRGHTPAPSAMVRAVLVEMLPLDEESLLEANVAFAFLVRAAAEPSMGERLRDQSRQLLEFLAGQIRTAGRESDALAPSAAAQKAEALIAFVDGLAAHTLAGFHEPDAALAVLERRLAQIFHESDQAG